MTVAVMAEVVVVVVVIVLVVVVVVAAAPVPVALGVAEGRQNLIERKKITRLSSRQSLTC